MYDVEVDQNHSTVEGKNRLQTVQVHRNPNIAPPKMKHMMLSSTVATGLFFSAPLITEAALGDQPLTEGMSHPDVKQLQEALKDKGHFTYHTATGYYGSITAKAVADFQRAHGLPVNGQATRATLDQILAQSQVSSKSATANASLSTQQVLRQGTSSSQVGSLQRQLKEAGYFKHEVTGYYGRITTEAVRSFQRANRLTVDGIAGPKTLNALQNATAVTMEQVQPSPAPTTSSATPAQSNTVIRVGSTGQAVERLQQRLRDLGYFQGTVNGQFNETTSEAVRRFQQQQRISVDGIVGPQTWRALDSASVVAPAKPSALTPAPSTPAQTGSTSGSTVLRVGSQSPAVSNLQSQLKVIGLFNQNPTGYFGTITEQAVRAFQRQQGLTPDGIAGPKTVQLLNQLAGSPAPAEATNSFNVMNLVADASEQLGVPYVWGGTTTAGFDCSGFLQYIFAKSNVSIPRTVASMWEVGTSVGEPRIGDLVFFTTYAPGASHAGIYIGNGQFVHSGSSTGVTIANMSTKYWNDRYIGAKRLH
ncbi:C40 family peptidase [Halalkalibacter nanhaiisediminis]|uniref:Cell wall-associated NlpC family hydrolase n=1 Tax=Halalkalibacter nanhaiisediminis TaxID=688079 RepID=A0A562QUK8_9BACI|nr:peptidoglycan-binding protein [Halalkalibacter nanhaiisediminis]TWI59816.1 cell wall-associated NlpC family hydrolase [Halalkalibacter nanhaiisediminis]